MFKESIFSLFNKIFIRNEDFIQSLITAGITINSVYN